MRDILARMIVSATSPQQGFRPASARYVSGAELAHRCLLLLCLLVTAGCAEFSIEDLREWHERRPHGGATDAGFQAGAVLADGALPADVARDAGEALQP